MLNVVCYREKVFPDYFIDTESGKITDKNGNVECFGFAKTYLNWRSMPVHCIQVHSAYGYKKGYDVHHVNENKLDNSLSNLEYLPHGGHSAITDINKQIHSKQSPPTLEDVIKFLLNLGIALKSQSCAMKNYWYRKKHNII